jgi:hypothetical protein
MNHIDERDAAAAMDRVEAYQREHSGQPGMNGIVARLNLAALRPIYEAMFKEINAGATPDQISAGLAAMVSNIVLTVADSISAREPARRQQEIERFLFLLEWCMAKDVEDTEPDAVHRVAVTRAGRA